MIPRPEEQGWATAFDWEQEGREATQETFVSSRLLKWLQQEGATTSRDPNTPMARFGRYVKALRETRGWSRLELAKAAAIDPLAVPLLENAALPESELTYNLVYRLTDAIGIARRDIAIWPFPSAVPVPVQRQNFGAQIRASLRDLLRTPVARRVTLGGDIRQQAAVSGEDSDLETGLLERSMALPIIAVALPDGRTVSVQSALTSGDPPRGGVADVQLRVLDDSDTPVPGLIASIEIEGLPLSSARTDEQGTATVKGVLLVKLAGLEQFAVKLEPE